MPRLTTSRLAILHTRGSCWRTLSPRRRRGPSAPASEHASRVCTPSRPIFPGLWLCTARRWQRRTTTEARLEAEAGLAVALMRMLTDLPSAARHARAAAAQADKRGDPDARSELLARAGFIEGVLGRPAALQHAEQAAQLERRGRGGEGYDQFYGASRSTVHAWGALVVDRR